MGMEGWRDGGMEGWRDGGERGKHTLKGRTALPFLSVSKQLTIEEGPAPWLVAFRCLFTAAWTRGFFLVAEDKCPLLLSSSTGGKQGFCLLKDDLEKMKVLPLDERVV
ncbi:unnamed protein product [Pleuronectes platessa]|uniref:Uncharacterized protein n=1 Tax=Pleuronectes platessa TaxID=8262 RepID=A0A9N7VHV1_PLEPL|nr:unnamed protein product [Pleuronectes platessa]